MSQSINNRYIIMEYSKSAHCCFGYTVMDSTKPDMIGDKQYEDENGLHYETICETFTKKEAELICNALNRMNNG